MQLIQSVLAGIQHYWAGMFILPKSVLKHVELLLRRFLWSGGIDKAHGAKVSWDNVCKPKKEGGLGFKDLVLINKISNLKHIWTLFNPTTTSLWANWIKTYMLKGKSFWIVKPPSQCSWYWKKLLKLRELAKPLILHKVGTGSGTFLWYDNWHPLGPLLDKFGPSIAYDAALSLNAKVSDVIHNDDWNWPQTNTLQLMTIRDNLHLLPSPSDTQDVIRWLPSPNGLFSLAHTWDQVRDHGPKVPWHRLIWFPGNIPRHSFISWLAILHRLSTHDRIYTFTPGPLACTLCFSGMESHDHLFFNCPYSYFVWQELLHRIGVRKLNTSWSSLVDWGAKLWKRKTPMHIIGRMCFGLAVYSIWRERNSRSFTSLAKTKERILKDICHQMVTQIQIKWWGDPQLSLYLERWTLH